jgi:hypothetical protein
MIAAITKGTEVNFRGILGKVADLMIILSKLKSVTIPLSVQRHNVEHNA